MGPYLIDTNVIIEYCGKRLPTAAIDWLENLIDAEEGAFSIKNWIEIFSYPMKDDESAIFSDFCERLTLLYLNDEIAARTAPLRQTAKIKLPDAVIAATALHFELTLVTNNVKDINGIPQITVVNPHQM